MSGLSSEPSPTIEARSALQRPSASRKRAAANGSKPALAIVLMPMRSASNSCSREKWAIDSFIRAACSSPICGLSSTCCETRVKSARGALEFGALGGVTRRDVGDLVRHHRGDLGSVVGEGEQAAGDENVACGQREGVDDGRIQQRDVINLGRRVACGREPDERLVEIIFDRRRIVLAAERVDEPLAPRNFPAPRVSPPLRRRGSPPTRRPSIPALLQPTSASIATRANATPAASRPARAISNRQSMLIRLATAQLPRPARSSRDRSARFAARIDHPDNRARVPFGPSAPQD